MPYFISKSPVLLVEAYQFTAESLEFIQEWAQCRVSRYEHRGEEENVLMVEFGDEASGVHTYYAYIGDYMVSYDGKAFEIITSETFKQDFESALSPPQEKGTMLQRFVRKYQAVFAIQLTEENLDKVETWSNGKLKARPTNRSGTRPPIVVESTTDSSRRYADRDWWLLVYDNGNFDVMVDSKFKEEFVSFYENEAADHIPHTVDLGGS